MSVEKSLALGNVWQILAQTSRAAFSLAAIDFQIAAPVGLRQIVFHYSDSGRPIGYVVWAFCTEVVLKQILADENKILHVSEWNEGDLCVVLDVVCVDGGIRPLLGKFRARVISTHAVVCYIRSARGRRRLRRVTLAAPHAGAALS